MFNGVGFEKCVQRLCQFYSLPRFTLVGSDNTELGHVNSSLEVGVYGAKDVFLVTSEFDRPFDERMLFLIHLQNRQSALPFWLL